MPKRKKEEENRFKWVPKDLKGLKIEGKPNYKEISLTRDGVRVTKRGETPR